MASPTDLNTLLDLLAAEEEEELFLVQLLHQVTKNGAFVVGQPTQIGGSVTGRIERDRERVLKHQRLYKHYFAEDPTYDATIFRRRFRMRRPLFLRIVDAVGHHDKYFTQRMDAAYRLGLSPLQKATAAMRQLAYGVPADSVDEYLGIGESTAIESLQRFTRSVVAKYGEEYLRAPTAADVQRLLTIGEARGFPGMLGSLDCMHWTWKNCPVAWQGQYSGKEKEPTIVLEAVASYDLWIWHAFFGMPGSHNDINILQRSPLFAALADGKAPVANFTVNRKQYNMGYYLADGIYPQWATLVQTISQPQGPKKKHFAKMQESARKDVERAFGVLQARFAIIKGPARFWQQEDLYFIMMACIILHNMIIEDERDLRNPDYMYDNGPAPVIPVSREPTADFASFVTRYRNIRDSGKHYELRNDLIEHLWSRKGETD